MKTAEKDIGPNKKAAELKPQNEKERLQKDIQRLDEKLAALWQSHQANLAALPAEPELPSSFGDWVKDNKMAELSAVPYWERKKAGERLAREYAGTTEGRGAAAEWVNWANRYDKIFADYEAKKLNAESERLLLVKCLSEIEATEKRKERATQDRGAQRSKLVDEIGYELAREIDPKHPDFDRGAFENFMAFRYWDDSRDVALNAVLFGPPRTGKTRAMAAWALENVRAYSSNAWITGADFAALVSALGDNAEKAEAKRRLRMLAEVDRLFFDDLGSAHFTAARVTHFFTLMNARYTAGLPTLFTTNHGVQEMREMLIRAVTKDTKDKATEIPSEEAEMQADRILWRINGTPADPRAEFFHFRRQRKNRTSTSPTS